MDRQIVTPGQIPLDTDLLNTNKNVMLALGDAFSALFGANTIAYGLQVTQTAPASLTVNVSPGSIYALSTVDATPYGSIAADTTDTIVKQGILLGGTSIALVPPTTAGYSQNVLIEAAFNEVDGLPQLLPFYNSANPQQPLQGPGGNNQQTNTRRQGQVSITPKYGVAAATGTQTTPAPDAGYIGLAVITLTYGQTQITAGNISAQTANVLQASVLQGIQSNAFGYAKDTGVSNALVVNLQPSITSLFDGMIIETQVAVTNTHGATLNVCGTGALPILGGGHLALQGGELVAGGKAAFMYHSGLNSWILLEASGGAQQIGPASQSNHAMQLGQATGRLLRTTIYTIIGGVQEVSVNGGAFTSVGAATFTSLAQTNSVIVEGVGGGGSGGGSPACTSAQATGGAGGGSGAYFKLLLTSGFSGGIAIAIGAGGVGASGVAGTSGGATSFGAIASAPGGGFGTAGSATSTFPQIVGYGSGGSQATGGTLINAAGSFGASSFTLGISSAISGSGGTSVFGGGGSAKINTSSAGNPGSSPGSGGSGALTMASGAAQTGGNGAAGMIIVYEFA